MRVKILIHLCNWSSTFIRSLCCNFPHLNADMTCGHDISLKHITRFLLSPGSSCVRPRLVPHARRFGEKHGSEAFAGFFMCSSSDGDQHLLHPYCSKTRTCSSSSKVHERELAWDKQLDRNDWLKKSEQMKIHFFKISVDWWIIRAPAERDRNRHAGLGWDFPVRRYGARASWDQQQRTAAFQSHPPACRNRTVPSRRTRVNGKHHAGRRSRTSCALSSRPAWRMKDCHFAKHYLWMYFKNILVLLNEYDYLWSFSFLLLILKLAHHQHGAEVLYIKCTSII